MAMSTRLLQALRPTLFRSVTHTSPFLRASSHQCLSPFSPLCPPSIAQSRFYVSKKGKAKKKGIKLTQEEQDEQDKEDEEEGELKEAEKKEVEKDEAKKDDKAEVKEDKDNKDNKENKEKEGDKAVEEKEDKENKAKKSKGKEAKQKGKGKKGDGEVVSSGNVLDDTVRMIEKAFGKGSLMKLTNSTVTPIDPSEVIPTGSLGLDLALGIGGLPAGRVTEIYGPESSGKTTLALHVIAEAQKMGKFCAFIDAEHALNSHWAARLGVNTDELLVSQPDSGEQALEIVDSLIKAGNTHVIVVDSVAALVPKVELQGEMGDSHIGVQARLMSQALRKISPSLNKSKCVLIFINQIRMKIGVMYGSPETTTGGNALKFYSSVRLEIRRIGQIKIKDDVEKVTGNQIRVKVNKNKLAPPFREALFDIDFGKGISKLGEIIDWGVKAGVLEKMGAWYTYNGTQLGQGREKVKLYLEEHPAITKEIESAIRKNQTGIVVDTGGEEALEEEDGEHDGEDAE